MNYRVVSGQLDMLVEVNGGPDKAIAEALARNEKKRKRFVLSSEIEVTPIDKKPVKFVTTEILKKLGKWEEAKA